MCYCWLLPDSCWRNIHNTSISILLELDINNLKLYVLAQKETVVYTAIISYTSSIKATSHLALTHMFEKNKLKSPWEYPE